jgi:protein TonB
MSALAEEDLDHPPSPLVVWGKRLGFVLVAVVIAYGVVQVVKSFGVNAQHARKVAKIAIVPNTPPPPPPKEEKKPEPKEQPKEFHTQQPKEVQAPQAPQPEQLKMEGAAGETASPFASGEVRNDYVGGPTGSGPSAGGRMAFTFYTQEVQRHFQEELLRNREVRRLEYKVTVRVWLDRNGAVERVEMLDSTGSSEGDRLLRDALAAIPALKDPPPENMPQPLKVRITNRLTG